MQAEFVPSRRDKGLYERSDKRWSNRFLFGIPASRRCFCGKFVHLLGRGGERRSNRQLATLSQSGLLDGAGRSMTDRLCGVLLSCMHVCERAALHFAFRWKVRRQDA